MKYRLFYCILCAWCLSVVMAVAGQKTWQLLPPLPFDGAVQNVSVNDNGVLYVSTGEYVYKSTDNGATWTGVGEGVIWGDITDISTFPGKPNTIIVSTSTGIFWSMNGGSSWSRDRFEVNSHTGLGGGAGAVFPHVKSGRIFAGTYIMSLSGGWQRTHPEKYTYYYAFYPDGTVLSLTGGNKSAELLRSTSGGFSWESTSTLPGTGPMFVDGNDRVYAFAEHYEFTGTEVVRSYPVFTSDDKGSHWADFTVGTQGLPEKDSRVQVLSIDRTTNNVYATVYDPANFYGKGIYVSTDAMKTWKLLDQELSDVRPHEMVMLPGGGFALATENRGLVIYDPAQQPAVRNGNGDLVSTDRLTLYTTKSGRLFAAGVGNGKMKYTDNGTTWNTTVVDQRAVQIRAIAELPNGDLLLGSLGSKVYNTSALYRSTDGGATWQTFGSGIIDDSANWTGIYEFFSDNSGKLYAFTENSGGIMQNALLVSTDNGATWKGIEGILGSCVVLPNGSIFTTGMDSTFASFFRRSTNGGKTWDSVAGPRAIGMSTQPQLSTDPQGALYFRSHQGDTLFASRDNGITWEVVDGEPYSRAYVDATGKTFLVYSATDVYLKENGSTEKTKITDGLPTGNSAPTIISMAFGANNMPFAAFSNGAVYRLTEGIASGVVDGPAALQGVAAYPNPFAERLVIAYTLPQASAVSLTLFDILGNEVQTVVVSAQSTGNNTLVVDGSNLVPGLYTYKIMAGNFVQSGTVVRN